MSDTATRAARPERDATRPDPAAPRRRYRPGPMVAVAVGFVVVAGLGPFFLDRFWLQVGVFSMAAVVGAIGLNLLVGTAGQLSLAHAFFLAVGAYGYVFFASHPSTGAGGVRLVGLGLPPVVAVVLAVMLAGATGLVLSPIAGRLRGIYFGVASLGLVFLGQHVLFNATNVTGGFNGRDVPAFSVFGFAFADHYPPRYVGNTRFGLTESLWELFVIVVVVAVWYTANVVSQRPGRALQAVRDREVAAAILGVDVARAKAQVFMVSSMYAGLAGVMTAVAFRRIVPDTWGLELSIDYLAMIVIGGLGSVYGSAVGAVFVTALPLLLQRFSSSLPFLAQPGEGGVTSGIAARFAYGAAVIVVLLFEPGGAAALGRRLRRLRPRWGPGAAPPVSDAAGSSSAAEEQGGSER